MSWSGLSGDLLAMDLQKYTSDDVSNGIEDHLHHEPLEAVIPSTDGQKSSTVEDTTSSEDKLTGIGWSDLPDNSSEGLIVGREKVLEADGNASANDLGEVEVGNLFSEDAQNSDALSSEVLKRQRKEKKRMWNEKNLEGIWKKVLIWFPFYYGQMSVGCSWLLFSPVEIIKI